MTDERRTPVARVTREAIARAQGRRKLDLLLAPDDAGGLVRSLPAEDLYLAIQEIGLTDSSQLVQLASPEQFRTFVDLDAFRKGELEPERLLTWLRLARGGGGNEYRRKLAALDVEVIELLLLGLVRIFDLEEDGEPPDDLDGTIEHTPEGRFALVYETSGPEYGAARQVIDDLYADDPFMAGRILYSVRCELPSELTEQAFRWRNGRLADLGFPSPEEAASLYARAPRRTAVEGRPAPPDAPPGFFLATLPRRELLLERALSLLEAEEREELELQVVALVNMALVADAVELDDVDRVRQVAGYLRDGLSLGLHELSGGVPDAAAEQLLLLPAKRIFQEGFTRALELRHRAEALVAELPLRFPGSKGFLPDSPDGEALAALLSKRPLFALGLLVPGSTEERGFAAPEELAAAAAALDRTMLLGELFQEARFSPKSAEDAVVGAEGPAGLARMRFSDLFLTAAARDAAGAGFAFAALPVALLPEAVRRAFTPDGKLRPVFRELATDALLRYAEQRTPAHEAAARLFASAALDRLDAELGPQVAAGGVDRRTAAPLLVGG